MKRQRLENHASNSRASEEWKKILRTFLSPDVRIRNCGRKRLATFVAQCLDFNSTNSSRQSCFQILGDLLLELCRLCLYSIKWETRVVASGALHDCMESWPSLTDAFHICKREGVFVSFDSFDLDQVFDLAAPLMKQNANAFGEEAGNSLNIDRERSELLKNLRLSSLQSSLFRGAATNESQEECDTVQENLISRTDLESVFESDEPVPNKNQVVDDTIHVKELMSKRLNNLSARQVAQKRFNNYDNIGEDDLRSLLDSKHFSKAQSFGELLSIVHTTLIQHIVSDQWGSRHGAAAALCALVRHIRSQKQMEEAKCISVDAVEDIVVRCLCVLGIDRFGDFSSDGVVAPVREICAQLVALCTTAHNQRKILQYLKRMLVVSGELKIENSNISVKNTTVWGRRYSSLLAYKYIATLSSASERPDFESLILEAILPGTANVLLLESERKPNVKRKKGDSLLSIISAETPTYNDDIRRAAADVLLVALDPKGTMFTGRKVVADVPKIRRVFEICAPGGNVEDFLRRLWTLLGHLNDGILVSAGNLCKVCALSLLGWQQEVSLCEIFSPKLLNPSSNVRIAALESLLFLFHQGLCDNNAKLSVYSGAGNTLGWLDISLKSLLLESSMLSAAIGNSVLDDEVRIFKRLLEYSKDLWQTIARIEMDVNGSIKEVNGTMNAVNMLFSHSDVKNNEAEFNVHRDTALFAIQCIFEADNSGQFVSAVRQRLLELCGRCQNSLFLLTEVVARVSIRYPKNPCCRLVHDLSQLALSSAWANNADCQTRTNRQRLISSITLLCKSLVNSGVSPTSLGEFSCTLNDSSGFLESKANVNLISAATEIFSKPASFWLSQLVDAGSKEENTTRKESIVSLCESVSLDCVSLQESVDRSRMIFLALSSSIDVFCFKGNIGNSLIGPIIRPLMKPFLSSKPLCLVSSSAAEILSRACVCLMKMLHDCGKVREKALWKLGAKLVGCELKGSSLVFRMMFRDEKLSECRLWELLPFLKQSLLDKLLAVSTPDDEMNEKLLQIVTIFVKCEVCCDKDCTLIKDSLSAAFRWLTNSSSTNSVETVSDFFGSCIHHHDLRKDAWLVLHALVMPVIQGNIVETCTVESRLVSLKLLLEILNSNVNECLTQVSALIAPVIQALQDPVSKQIREAAGSCFALLIELAPIEEDMDYALNSKGDAILKRAKAHGSKFLDGLLAGADCLEYSEISEFAKQHSIELRDYQKEGIKWLAFLAGYGLSGALCDDLGLGKTLMALTQLVLCKTPRRVSMIVCPSSLTGHWAQECRTWYPNDIFPVEYVGNPSIRQGRIVDTVRKLGTHSKHVLIIVSFHSLSRDIAVLERLNYRYCIVDEAHTMRNPYSVLLESVKRAGLRSVHRIALTGTPVHNDVSDIWSIFDFLMPGYLGEFDDFQKNTAKVVRASREQFNVATEMQREQSLSKADERQSSLTSRDRQCDRPESLDSVENDGNDSVLYSEENNGKVSKADQAKKLIQQRASEALDSLHRRVLPFILRRTKDEVLQDLPPKIVQDLLLDLTPHQESFYDQLLRDFQLDCMSAFSSEEEIDSPARSSTILGDISRLLLVCTHPLAYLRGKMKQANGRLAKRQLEEKMSMIKDLGLRVSNKFIALESILSDNLLAGRVDGMNQLDDSASKLEVDVLGCGVAAGEKATTSSGPVKAVVFCQWSGTIDLVEQQVLRRGILKELGYLRLDGSIEASKRQDVVNKFNEDPNICLLLATTKIGGQGINLSTANIVIFLECSWNPFDDLQAMDRAHRIGQKRVLQVFRLISRNTLEEKVMNVQIFKMHIARKIVGDDNKDLENMKTHKILELLNQPHEEAKLQHGRKRRALQNPTSDLSVPEPLISVGKVSKMVKKLDELWSETEYDDFSATKLFNSVTQ